MSSTVKVSGLVQVYPQNPTSSGGLSASIELDARRAYGKHEAGSVSVAAPSTPFQINPGGIAAVKLACLRSLDGASFVAIVTSAAGTAQQTPFSDTFYVNTPGSPITAISLLGTGRIEYVLAGD